MCRGCIWWILGGTEWMCWGCIWWILGGIEWMCWGCLCKPQRKIG